MTDANGRSVPRLPDKVLRGAVALLGIVAFGIVVLVLVALAMYMGREPQTPAEAHAMAHSAVGIVLVAVGGTVGFGLIGTILLAIAYVDRRRLSALTLLVTGLVALPLLAGQLGGLLEVASLIVAALGAYGLYERPSRRDPLRFFAGATAVLWFVQLLLVYGRHLGVDGMLFLSWRYQLAMWTWWLLGAGAFAVLASVALYYYADREVPVAPIVLAASVALWFLLAEIRVAFSGPLVYEIPVDVWIHMAITSGVAVVVLARPLRDSVSSLS